MASQPVTSINELIEVNDPVVVILGRARDPSGVVRFASFVRRVLEDRLLIYIPADVIPAAKHLLRPNLSVSIEFASGQQEAPRIDTSIIDYQQIDTPGLWVHVPVNFKDSFLKRRRLVRVPIKFPFTASYKDPDKSREPIRCISINLSAGGMRFATQHCFELNDEIVLEFKPDSRSQVFRVEGTVLLSKPSAYKLTGSLAERVVAVQFHNLTRHQEDVLVGLCFRKELEQRKHLKRE